MCNHVILSILSVWNENPWVSLIAYIPSALLGSGQTLAAYCYASDISESDKRPLYMASMGGCLSAGLVVGTLTGPLIFQKLNYTFLYVISASLCAISLLYVLFLIPETVKNRSAKWESPFSWSLLKELIVACTKKGDGSSRKLLWSFLSIFSFYTIINNGTITINYLFANARFGWSKIEFSTYYGSATIVTIVGTIIGLEIMKNRTDVNDFAKILVGSLSGFAAAVTFSFTWKPWHIYLGSVLGILTGVIVPISRSAISKSVLSDDLGKVFSVVSFIETILPLGSAPLYTLVYSSYIADYPTPVFLLSTIMYFFMVVIAGVMNSRFIRYHNSEQKINGPKPLPFIGTIKDVLIGRLSIGNYTKKIYDQYPNERVVGVYAGMKKVLLLRDLELIKDVMIKDFSSFVDRGIGYHDKHEPLSANVGFVDEDQWRLLRRKLTPMFSPIKLKKMINLLVECADRLNENLMSVMGEDVEVRAVMERFAIDVIGICGFGLKTDALMDEDNIFYKMGRRIFSKNLKNLIRLRIKSYAPLLYKFIGSYLTDWEMQKFFIDITRQSIEHRIKYNINRNDFIDLLMALKEKSQEDDDARSTISNCIFELALNHTVQNKLREEINDELMRSGGEITYDGINNLKYLDKVMCETLRKYPPVNFTLRRSTQSYKFADINLTIPKGTTIWIPIFGIHYDSKYYKNPQVFDPERFNDEELNNRPQMSYLPFGLGPRNCIGLRFAKMEVKIALVKLLQTFKFDVCNKTDINYTINEKLFLLAPLNGIHVKVSKTEQNKN
ncbi:hypothetical protein KQX54_017803 [Cotesia glomerata]|uniref:Cytochrome P450 n=1 Tax=Cotesia glomerata TaxID=32391 RepID=A0AAV7HYJ0_COTGL|nr:hypothetical protein KQX54_017803 [Cotesia glomerata]